MKKTVFLAAALSALAAPAVLLAKDAEKPAAPAPGTNPEDIQRGVMIIRGFAAALGSDNVTKEQKGAIIACLYNNPVRQISVAAGNVFAKNDKLDPTKPGQVHAVAAAICRVPRPAPAATDSSKGQGR